MMYLTEQLMDEMGLPMYHRVFDITLDRDDIIDQSRVLKELKKECGNINHGRITRELQMIIDDDCCENGVGSFKVTGHNVTYGQPNRKKEYRGLKLREQQAFGGDNNGGYAFGFQP